MLGNYSLPVLKASAAVVVDADDSSGYRETGGAGEFQFDPLPTEKLGTRLYGSYSRTVEATNSPAGDFAFPSNVLQIGTAMTWRTGHILSPQMDEMALYGLETQVGYRQEHHWFDASRFATLRNARQYVRLDGGWRVLPFTRLVYSTELGMVRYTAEQTALNDSTPVRARIGMQSPMSAFVTLKAIVGWGASFSSGNNSPAHDFDSVIAAVELKLSMLQQPALEHDRSVNSSLRVGYTRDFDTSYIADHYGYDRLYMQLAWKPVYTATVTVDAGFSHLRHPQSYWNQGVARYSAYTENRIDAQLFAELLVSDNVGLNTTLRYDANLTEASLPENLNQSESPEFSRFRVYGGLRFLM
jgi:hypothetical protein